MAKVVAEWAVLTAVLAVVSPALAVNDLTLTVAPGSASVRPGDTVTVTLGVSNLSTAINGVQSLLGYDPSVLSLVDIVPTNLGLAPPAAGWVEVMFSDVAGAVAYTVVVNGGSVAINHTVATLTFTAIDEGATNVIFRPDSGPFATKLTVAADNSTIFPNKVNSGAITIQCTDGVFCNGVETFNGVSCQPGTNPCNDGVGCTVDVCNEGTDSCTNTPNHATCNDGLFCTGIESCHAVNGCQPGVFPCNDGVACTVDNCNEATDSCGSTENDANCDDGLFCNGAEMCDSVAGCLAGGNPCIDGIPCTVDSCNETTNQCIFSPNDNVCDNGLFCDGDEFCDNALGCRPGTNPCGASQCDEPTDQCVAPVHVAGLELFYAGRFGNAPNPQKRFLAAGSTSNGTNIVTYSRGITGIRVRFDTIVSFATTASNAFGFEWTTGTGSAFTPVANVAAMISATASTAGGATVVDVVLVDHHVKQRWLKVTILASQVSVGGTPLDGELSGNPVVMPSGNGTPGGNAVFYIGNLTGDVDNDRKITLTDVGLIRGLVNPFVSVPITHVYDVDKDGKVLLADVGTTRADVNPFFTLPVLVP